MRTPASISFRANGTAIIKDADGKRVHELEGVTHADSIALLRFNGFNWRKLTRVGEPTSYPVRR